jgi:hypothetical protein
MSRTNPNPTQHPFSLLGSLGLVLPLVALGKPWGLVFVGLLRGTPICPSPVRAVVEPAA